MSHPSTPPQPPRRNPLSPNKNAGRGAVVAAAGALLAQRLADGGTDPQVASLLGAAAGGILARIGASARDYLHDHPDVGFFSYAALRVLSLLG